MSSGVRRGDIRRIVSFLSSSWIPWIPHHCHHHHHDLHFTSTRGSGTTVEIQTFHFILNFTRKENYWLTWEMKMKIMPKVNKSKCNLIMFCKKLNQTVWCQKQQKWIRSVDLSWDRFETFQQFCMNILENLLMKNSYRYPHEPNFHIKGPAIAIKLWLMVRAE